MPSFGSGEHIEHMFVFVLELVAMMNVRAVLR